MVARVAWRARDNRAGAPLLNWIETQDIVIFPGCHEISLDLVTNPAAGLHDQFSAWFYSPVTKRLEDSGYVTGWRGVNIEALRFDLNEDRGVRGFTLRNVKLADDAAFSTSYPITFRDQAAAPGTVADIYVTTDERGLNGTQIARGVSVQAGTNTFTWNGTRVDGSSMPNGTYWVYMVMRNTAGVGSGYSTGPVRLERPVPSAPSAYVPLMPARVLDTR
ncbi:MAG TPA: hypothetical protein PLV68_02480, partial [Ilumatobacteraceae bacterium]|nr:hypothetical protein [Ilumatobacteraceae bacterium]